MQEIMDGIRAPKSLEDSSDSFSGKDDYFDNEESTSSNNYEINMLESTPNQNNIKKRKKLKFCQHIKWTKHEDDILCQLVTIFGENDWRHLSKKIDGRNSRQCRERWQYYLNPNLNVGNWTQEEDQLILSKLKEYGHKWMIIKNFFNNRTDAMIKNRYKALTKTYKQENFNNIVTEKQQIHDQNDHISHQKNKSTDLKHSNQSEISKKKENSDYLNYFNRNENDDDNYSNYIDFSIEMKI